MIFSLIPNTINHIFVFDEEIKTIFLIITPVSDRTFKNFCSCPVPTQRLILCTDFWILHPTIYKKQTQASNEHEQQNSQQFFERHDKLSFHLQRVRYLDLTITYYNHLTLSSRINYHNIRYNARQT